MNIKNNKEKKIAIKGIEIFLKNHPILLALFKSCISKGSFGIIYNIFYSNDHEHSSFSLEECLLIYIGLGFFDIFPIPFHMIKNLKQDDFINLKKAFKFMREKNFYNLEKSTKLRDKNKLFYLRIGTKVITSHEGA